MDVLLFARLSGLLQRPVRKWNETGSSFATMLDIVFLAEHHVHGQGMFSRWEVNTGFYVLRNTAKVRKFFGFW